MSFTHSLKGIPTVHFEHSGNLTQFPYPSISCPIKLSIERISRGNFELKIEIEYTIIQDRKQIVKIVTVSEFSITEDTQISFKPDIKVCVEAVKEALEGTKNYLYNHSKGIFYKDNYTMPMPNDMSIISAVTTALRTMT